MELQSVPPKKIAPNLKCEDITGILIESIKDLDQFIEIVLLWKKETDGKPSDIKISNVKNTIYRHFLYPKCRNIIMIYEMTNIWQEPSSI